MVLMTFGVENYWELKAPKSGLSGGAIAGIVIGCIAFVVLVGVGIYCLAKKKKTEGGDFYTKAN